MGEYNYPDKGNMTKPEIDRTMKVLTEAKKSGQFRAFWKDFNESVNLMASGETVIQSMWSPAVTAVKSKGIPCVYQPLAEGYRAWAAGFALSKSIKGTPKADLAYEFVNWFLDGWAGAYLIARVTTRPCSRRQRRRWNPTNGRSGWRANRQSRTSRRRTEHCWRRPALSVMVAPT